MNKVEHMPLLHVGVSSGYMTRNSIAGCSDQSVDNSVLLRRGNQLPMGGDTETKCVTETEGKVI